MSIPALISLSLAWSGLVWLMAYLICCLNPRPKLAQAIWRSAALLLVLPFLAAPFLPGLPAQTALPIDDLIMFEPQFIQTGQVLAVEAVRPQIEWPSLTELIIGVLVLGWIGRAILWIWGQARLQLIKNRSCGVRRPVRHWADALELMRVPDVRMIQTGSPFLAGIIRPIIYVPAALLDSRDGGPIIVHEMVHLKRGDLLTRPVERGIADLFWFSPFAWLIRERLDYWREAVVDEETARLTGDPIAYAKALSRAARVAAPVRTLPVAALNLTRKGTLKMRLSHLLDAQPRQSGRIGFAMIVAGSLAVPLALAQGTLIKGEGAAISATVTYSHPVLEHARLTSQYGMRNDPFTKQPRFHNGTDLAAPLGTPIYAPADGVVTFSDRKPGYGNLVELQVASNSTLRFGQLDSLNVAEGERVRAGEIVGLMGSSGRSTGPHLHIEIWRDGEPVDPQAEEGLVLVQERQATVRKPLPPPAPAPPSPPTAPVPVEPVAAPAPPSPPAPPVPPKAGACPEIDEDLTTAAQEMWDDRLALAKMANSQAGQVRDPSELLPTTVTYPAPVYPDLAIQTNAMGACQVIFDLSQAGMAENVAALCTDPMFEQSAIDGMAAARFEPVTDSAGQPVKLSGVLYPLAYCIE